MKWYMLRSWVDGTGLQSFLTDAGSYDAAMGAVPSPGGYSVDQIIEFNPRVFNVAACGRYPGDGIVVGTGIDGQPGRTSWRGPWDPDRAAPTDYARAWRSRDMLDCVHFHGSGCERAKSLKAWGNRIKHTPDPFLILGGPHVFGLDAVSEMAETPRPQCLDIVQAVMGRILDLTPTQTPPPLLIEPMPPRAAGLALDAAAGKYSMRAVCNHTREVGVVSFWTFALRGGFYLPASRVCDETLVALDGSVPAEDRITIAREDILPYGAVPVFETAGMDLDELRAFTRE